MDISQFYEDNDMYIHLKIDIKESWIIFIWKQDYILLSCTMVVGTKDFKKSTKEFKKKYKIIWLRFAALQSHRF
jgi:hypothetical protein